MRIIVVFLFSAFLLLTGVMLGSSSQSVSSEADLIDEPESVISDHEVIADINRDAILVEQEEMNFLIENEEPPFKKTPTLTIAQVVEGVGLWFYDGAIEVASKIADLFLG